MAILLKKSRQLAQTFKLFSFTHVQRQGNAMAYSSAMYAFDVEFEA